MDLPSPKQDKVSGWRWVVMAASFVALFITGNAQYHAGAMQVAILRHFGCDVILSTWMMAYYMSLFALSAPVASVVINMASCRACVVLSGFLSLVGFLICAQVRNASLLFIGLTLAGVGQSLSWTGSVVILAYYFPEKTSLVTGVCMAGGAVGMFIHPPLFAFLDGVYGLPGAFLLSGAVGFHGTVCGCLMRPSSFERRRGQTSGGDSALAGVLHVLCGDWRDRLSVLTDRALLLFLLSVFIMSVSYHSLMVMLPTFVIRLSDLTPLEASFAISMTGVGSLFSRLVSGVIAQDPRVGRLLVYCGLLGVETLVSLLAPSLLTSGQIGVYTYCLLVGLYTGGVIILINPVVVDVVGLKKSATAFGFALFTMGVGGILGPPLIESVYERSKSPYILFGFLSALFCMASTSGCVVTFFLPTKTAEPAEPDDGFEPQNKDICTAPVDEPLLLQNTLKTGDSIVRCKSTPEDTLYKSERACAGTTDAIGSCENVCETDTFIGPDEDLLATEFIVQAPD